MEIGKQYKILGDASLEFHPELQPHGTIVECIENKGNNYFIVKLIDKCNQKINEKIGGWIININKLNYKNLV